MQDILKLKAPASQLETGSSGTTELDSEKKCTEEIFHPSPQIPRRPSTHIAGKAGKAGTDDPNNR
ncbi:hypothetical protein N7463_000888 [Penicillium fimorum]|uniref:Uncharacterized protein n=1 Tax=Penicillium fimorum TaxID=1882269 RepID=A0A9X0CBI9_9EURO|nr:hypothetical protein N7463_000888 [Penicillium fimorum]